ncbi:MAG TPA: Zn-dependent hydrolase, partial [Bacteroidetes bacterium]|nr:Zn-dependent hydrolase [Bacteroidota bacterium]
MKHISNPDLPIILKNWPGNPVSSSGRFFHPQYRFELTWADIIKWKSRPNPYARAKRKETWRATIIKDDTFLKNKKDGHIWLGHASFFFRINGRNILVDP